MNIRDLLALPAARSLPRSEVRMLIAHVLQCTTVWLIAHDDEPISGAAAAHVESLIARRVDGEPIAYLLGEREFYGRGFLCSPAALIPRPETELLVERALMAPLSPGGRGVGGEGEGGLAQGDGAPVKHPPLPNPLPPGERELSVLDVGTGTGCIAITLALELAAAKHLARITAIDISPNALALAQSNAQRLNAPVKLIQSNWFEALPSDAQFHIIVSNPPYIVPGDAHLSQGDLRFEPAIALADAVDGLQSYRELLKGAMKHLRPGGWLIVEHGYDQGETVPELFREAGLIDVAMHRDLAGQSRVTQGKVKL